MGSLVSYELSDGVATITMDDGKVNVLSLGMQAELHAAFDRAQSDGAVVILVGREGVFSAGFDLATIRAGGPQTSEMVQGGFELAARVLSFPFPVAMACQGHAVAMGVFLLLTGDYRVGAAGNYRLVANEVAIGLTVPHAAIAILRNRLTPAAFNRAAITAAPFSPDAAVEAGFLDQVVDAELVTDTVKATAVMMTTLDFNAHAATKRRVRADVLAALREGLDLDRAALEARLS